MLEGGIFVSGGRWGRFWVDDDTRRVCRGEGGYLIRELRLAWNGLAWKDRRVAGMHVAASVVKNTT